MMSLWRPAYVALGSNLNDPAAQLLFALERLRQLPQTRFYSLSRSFLTEPMGPQDQPQFVNAAAGLLTLLAPREFLNHLLQTERAMGRDRRERWGPRIIDLDLICLDALIVDEPGLQLPHPGVSVRNFVLYPLLDIAPDLIVPNHGRVSAMAARVSNTGISPIE